MAQSSFTKHEKAIVEKYMKALVTFIQPPYIHRYDKDELDSKSQGILHKLKYHRFLDTHPREVEGRISRLVEKFTVHNQLEKAERLRKLTSMFLDKQLSNTYEGVHHSILRLLVDMSKDSLSKSVMLDDSITKREARVKIESAEEVIKVREMLKKMDEELDPRKDTAEEDSSLDEQMDEEGFTSDKGDLGHRGNKKTTDAQARIEEKLDKINSVRMPIQSHVYSTENMSSNMFFGGLPLVSDMSALSAKNEAEYQTTDSIFDKIGKKRKVIDTNSTPQRE